MSQVLVLCYHAVSEDWPAALAVTPDGFRRQLSLLARRGWTGTTFTQAITAPQAPRTLAVTFDDAYLSVLERAFPILCSLGWPATVFAVSGFADRRQPLSWPGIDQWQGTGFASQLHGMEWGDLARLAAAGWEIGSHTHSHPRLTGIDDQQLASELTLSREEMEANLGRPCTAVAYPYGDVDERVAGAAAKAGYTAGAALSTSLRERGVMRWPRLGIYHRDGLGRFRLKMSRLTRRARAWSKR